VVVVSKISKFKCDCDAERLNEIYPSPTVNSVNSRVNFIQPLNVTITGIY